MRFRDEGVLQCLSHLRTLLARKPFDGDHKRARGRDLDRAFFSLPLAGAVPRGCDFGHAPVAFHQRTGVEAGELFGGGFGCPTRQRYQHIGSARLAGPLVGEVITASPCVCQLAAGLFAVPLPEQHGHIELP